jgi:SulP family sulfate permease
MPGDFFAQIKVLALHAHTVNPAALAIAAASLVLIFARPTLHRHHAGDRLARNPRSVRWLRHIPAPIVVLVLSTLAVSLSGLPVETIGSRFGGVPQGFPPFRLPTFTWELVKQLFGPIITLALLGAIESLLCARVSDNLINDRHDPNQELMAQGAANFITPFFGGLPATGTIARTVTNIRSGASSPVAGIVHSLTLLAIILIAAPLAKNIPLAALSAILLHVAFNMGEWHEFVKLMRFSMNYRILVLATFLLTVVIDLTTAVEVGLVLACVFFIYRISSLTRIEALTSHMLPQPLMPGVTAYSVFGSLFFGAVGKVENLIDAGAMPDKAMILELHQLINLDTTGLDALETVRKTLEKQGRHLIVCGANHQPLSLMQRTGFITRLGPGNYTTDLAQAVERANVLAA